MYPSFSREAGHRDLAQRLFEMQYELTDRLGFYLCGRKPGLYTCVAIVTYMTATRQLCKILACHC